MPHHKLSSIKHLASWLWKQWKDYRLQACLNASIGIILVLSDLAFVWTTKLSVDIATGIEKSVELSTAITLLIAIVVLQVALGLCSRWIRAILGVKSENLMQRRIFSQLLQSDWKSLKSYHTGNLINRIERDVRDVVTFLTENIPSLLTTVVQFTGAFLFLFWMDSTLACIIIFILPVFLICSKLYIRKMRRLTHEVRDTESRIQSIIQESLQHTLVIKTLERVGNTIERLHGTQRQLHSQVISKTRYATLSSGLLNVGFATGYLTTFIWGVSSLQQGLITYGALIAFIQLVGQIQGPVRTLSRFIPIFISSFTATERIMELEQIPLEEHKDTVKRFPESAGIRISNLSFSYTPTSRKIFDHFSFDFPPNSITAILGETGSGKTTLIRLLLSLTSPSEGNIQIYGHDGETLPTSPQTRCNFSYVPQGNTLLSGTIRENLLLGNPDASDEMMFHALDTAGADFVRNLPERLDTRCGEMGDGLSEGQAQRISIARALLKRSAILLLDEATSSLDSETEKRVLHNIIRNHQHQTLIFVTHRHEVLKYCTQSLTLEKKQKPAIQTS